MTEQEHAAATKAVAEYQSLRRQAEKLEAMLGCFNRIRECGETPAINFMDLKFQGTAHRPDSQSGGTYSCQAALSCSTTEPALVGLMNRLAGVTSAMVAAELEAVKRKLLAVTVQPAGPPDEKPPTEIPF